MFKAPGAFLGFLLWLDATHQPVSRHAIASGCYEYPAEPDAFPLAADRERNDRLSNENVDGRR